METAGRNAATIRGNAMTIQRYRAGVTFDVNLIRSEMTKDQCGEWCRYADIPSPPPWFERPDACGLWVRRQDDVMDTAALVCSSLRNAVEYYYVIGNSVRQMMFEGYLWQRIPAPSAVPTEGQQ